MLNIFTRLIPVNIDIHNSRLNFSFWFLSKKAGKKITYNNTDKDLEIFVLGVTTVKEGKDVINLGDDLTNR